jgi:hypothetical protein
MTLQDRMREVNALLSEPHRVLNALAMGAALTSVEIETAIAGLTQARDAVQDLAETAEKN